MAKLIMCKGLPGSGKSTWAKDQVHQWPSIVALVNKDDIRAKLGKSWSRELEKEVIQIRDGVIIGFLKAGYDTISDDTNLSRKHESRLRQIATQCGADFEIKSFLDVPIDVCIERDSKREGSARVGDKVIKSMAEQFLGYKPAPPQVVAYKADPTLPSAIICDLDGTLSLFEGLRGPFDYARCAGDKVNEAVLLILEAFDAAWQANEQYKSSIIYLSGREDRAREETAKFLNVNNCPPGPLYMRKSGDFRKDSIVKLELFDAHVRGKFNVKFVLDDRDQVVKMWRELGLTCLQVAPGDF